MFDTVRNNRFLVQVFLVLIALAMALSTLYYYVDSSNSVSVDAVATVDGVKITQAEFQESLRSTQERMRSNQQGVSDEQLNSPALRKAVLDSLINKRLFARYAQKHQLNISDEQLVAFITSVPDLQENGKFSKERYEALVAAQNLSKDVFEARLRQDLMTQQYMKAVSQATLISTTATNAYVAAQLEQRNVSLSVIQPDAFTAQVKLANGAAKAYYDANHKQFEVPEQVKAEYLVLSRDEVAADSAVPEDEIKKWYASHVDNYKQAAERRASHILITVDKSAPEAAVKAARAKIDAIAAQLKANSSASAFAELAKKNSQDPGSAAQNGDLGWFRKGAMVKVFEDTTYGLGKEGQISDVVRSDFGFHIIMLTGIHAEQTRTLDDVKPEIVIALRDQAVQKKFAEASEAFSNTVYEQADSLKPAAEKLHLTIKTSDWLTKGTPVSGSALSNTKLLTSLFSEDAIKNKRNTEAVEVTPGLLISARVLEHKPATTRAFDEVKASVEAYLTRVEANKLAAKAGQDTLAKLQKGEDNQKWELARWLPRSGVESIPASVVNAIFKAPAAKLPAYSGLTLPNGSYALFRIEAVKAYAGESSEQANALKQQYTQLVSNNELLAWIASLRQSFPVVVNEKVLNASSN